MAEQTPAPQPTGSAAEREAILNLQFRTGTMAHHQEKEANGRVSASPVAASPATMERIEALKAAEDARIGARQAEPGQAPAQSLTPQEIRVAVLGERQGAPGAAPSPLNQPPTGAPIDHFAIIAPDFDMASHNKRATEAVELADRIGHKGFTAVHTDGSMQAIGKVNGEWMRSDGKPLQDIMAERDRDLLRGIESRSESGTRDKASAEADAVAFRSIDGKPARESAAVVMTDNGHDSPAYRDALARTTAAHEVAALSAAHEAKMWAKEDTKGQAIMDSLAERAATARSWSATEAQEQALKASREYAAEQNPSEKAFKLEDMARDAKANVYYGMHAEHATPDLTRALRALDARTDVRSSAPAYPELRPGRAAANDENSIELNTERAQQSLPAADDAKRSAWLKKGAEAAPPPAAPEAPAKPGANKVMPDEVFKPADDVTRPIPADVAKQFDRVGNKFYQPADRERTDPAFEDKGNKLQTKSDSEMISDSLVRIAHARGWDDIKVSGTEQFRRQAWIEAQQLGMSVKGYTPTEEDIALAEGRKARKAQDAEKGAPPIRARETELGPATEPKPRTEAPAPAPAQAAPAATAARERDMNHDRAEAFATKPPAAAVKQFPELAGAAAAVTAMDKQAEADGLTPAQRAVVTARVRQNVVNAIERGDLPEVKLKETLQREPEREPQSRSAPKEQTR